MKKGLWLILMLVTMAASAQKDVTKFLGIPVDGSKAEMKRKLIDKGFTYNSQYDYFAGEFNGRDSHVYIATNNNKVWRIMVCDANSCDETNIKIRFNNLCLQFAKNQKYVPTNMGEEDYTISDKEDISYEMSVHNKRYQASYYQISESPSIDTLAVYNRIQTALLQKFTQEQIDNPTEKQQEEITSIVQSEAIKYTIESMEKKLVWFIISEELYGDYSITLYYDNEYNHSDGEDL